MSPDNEAVEIPDELAAIYELDEYGVAVLKKREGIDESEYLKKIDQIREEMEDLVG